MTHREKSKDHRMKPLPKKDPSSVRPVLSNDNVDIFYQKLEEAACSRTQFDNYKAAFALYIMNKERSNKDMVDIIASGVLVTKRDAQFILDTLVDLIGLIEHETASCNLGYQNFIPVKKPKAYLYVDHTGKKWACVNEYFGL